MIRVGAVRLEYEKSQAVTYFVSEGNPMPQILSCDEDNYMSLMSYPECNSGHGSIHNHIGQTSLEVAIARKHFEVAIRILKAGGKANKQGPLKDALRNQADEPVLDELKDLIVRDEPKKELS